MICAGWKEGGRDSCKADSGDPLIQTDNKQLIGVVSFGYGCAEPDAPGVYGRVTFVRDWIKTVTGI